MSNPVPQLYNIRDGAGNVYGPADLATLRQWVREGRILPSHLIGLAGAAGFSPVSSFPELADLFGAIPSPRPSAPGSAPLADYRSVPNTAFAPRTNSMALTAFILSLGTVFPGCCCIFLNFPLAVAAIIIGAVALKQIKQKGEIERGRGLAIAAIIIAIIFTLSCGTLNIIELMTGGFHRAWTFPPRF